MFGMGGSEIIVILIVALVFLGPDKLPQAAKSISKGIRDLKKQSRALQQQIESDEQIGGAIRDLKSALRGDEAPRPPVKPVIDPTTNHDAALAAAPLAGLGEGEAPGEAEVPAGDGHAAQDDGHAPAAGVTLPAAAGEADPVGDAGGGDDELASMIKPATGIVAKGSEPEHG